MLIQIYINLLKNHFPSNYDAEYHMLTVYVYALETTGSETKL